MVLSLVLTAVVVAFASWLLAFTGRRLALMARAVDQPTGGRKIHSAPTPLWGGLSVGVVLIAALLITHYALPVSHDIRPLQVTGFALALLVLLVGGLLDDRFNLSPRVQFIFPFIASLIVIASGTGIIQVTRLAGHGGFSLVWWRTVVPMFGHVIRVSFPSDLLTLAWLLTVTYAIKFLDGLDGLVAGQTVIGAGLIAALAFSHAFFQPSVAALALIIGAVYLGFLPHNVHPAKQFLGEAGSTIAGFSLAWLAIVSGAKVATALMALGVPLADATLVIAGRLLRGSSPFRGDDTHLHFKLLKAGLSQRRVVFVLWTVAILFGLAALGLQTRGKILLVATLFGVTGLLSWIVSLRKRA